jgi:hypothetical protein
MIGERGKKVQRRRLALRIARVDPTRVLRTGIWRRLQRRPEPFGDERVVRDPLVDLGRVDDGLLHRHERRKVDRGRGD